MEKYDRLCFYFIDFENIVTPFGVGVIIIANQSM